MNMDAGFRRHDNAGSGLAPTPGGAVSVTTRFSFILSDTAPLQRGLRTCGHSRVSRDYPDRNREEEALFDMLVMGVTTGVRQKCAGSPKLTFVQGIIKPSFSDGSRN
jgi:hypothetical protein